jgi:hypothetical protein
MAHLVASLSCEEYLESLTTILSSETLMDDIRTSINLMPQGQSSRCIEELASDVTETLNWMADCNFEDDVSKLREPCFAKKSIFFQKDELLGRHLSEVYVSILDSIFVTA